MEAIVRVCVSCHKMDQGRGLWTAAAGQPPGKTQKSLCPDCCRSRFPQFYDDLGSQPKATKGVSTILTTITKIIKTKNPSRI